MARLRPLDYARGEGGDSLEHGIGTNFEEQVERGIEAGKLLERKRDHFEASRVVAVHEVVLEHAREVVRIAHRHPRNVDRLEARYQLLPYVHKPRAPRRVEPLLRAAGEDVDLEVSQIERDRAHPLNRVDNEPDAASATGAPKATQVDAVSGREGHPGQHEGTHLRTVERRENGLFVN